MSREMDAGMRVAPSRLPPSSGEWFLSAPLPRGTIPLALIPGTPALVGASTAMLHLAALESATARNSKLLVVHCGPLLNPTNLEKARKARNLAPTNQVRGLEKTRKMLWRASALLVVGFAAAQVSGPLGSPMHVPVFRAERGRRRPPI